MKPLCLILCLQAIDSLPEQRVLLTAIDSFYQLQTENLLLEYQETKKGEWLKYLPTIGLSYTIDGRPRPTASWSSTLLYRARKENTLRAAKRKAIVQCQARAGETAKLKLQDLLLDYNLLLANLEEEKEMLFIEEQLFSIYQMQYDSLEMAPSDFLIKRKQLLEKKRRLRQLEGQGQKLILAIRRHCFLPNLPSKD